ncbi:MULTISPECIES: ATP-dependent zinc protease family protein [Planktothrix]|uniref:ATP-dependent zinc protease n=1 Tax=Planktothrix mougeotii LEGE 06226 TaxID=1828728 RepID=A0ABR9UIV5_9CYAN|nr:MULTISPECIES: RimK/LysX family protein [Planktothrix]MBD2482853.1 ATP-dependent zinc protease [Planktothrix sp. FACHB-1365]MBE9146395.1 ATP-dependent zinc protease [Planktothrix mougeotii LEGE 06226]
MTKTKLLIIGWREWVALPDLGIGKIKAKIDTGARSSSLHAFDIEIVQTPGELSQGKQRVRFKVHPLQRDTINTVSAEVDLLEYRPVRNSGGQTELRPVILTDIELMGKRWLMELTLTNRDAMGFRMLLGRQALKRRFLIDCRQSFLSDSQ